MKSPAERSVEALTWAAVVIWLGFALVTHILGYVWLVVMVLGFILLSSAIYQRSQGWHTSLSIWVFGIWMAVFSVLETVSQLWAVAYGGSGLNIDLWVYLGVALVSMGIAVIFRTVQGPRLLPASRGTNRARDWRGYEDSDALAPRRVDEDYGSAYFPPSQGRGRRQRSQPTYERQADYGYEQPGEGYARPEDQQRAATHRRAYDQGTSGEYAYEQPTVPYADQDAYPPEQPARYEPADSYRAPTPRRAPTRRPVSLQRQRRAQPAEAPSDLESRVEEIIRRSRERRNIPPEDLPY